MRYCAMCARIIDPGTEIEKRGHRGKPIYYHMNCIPIHDSRAWYPQDEVKQIDAITTDAIKPAFIVKKKT